MSQNTAGRMSVPLTTPIGEDSQNSFFARTAESILRSYGCSLCQLVNLVPTLSLHLNLVCCLTLLTMRASFFAPLTKSGLFPKSSTNYFSHLAFSPVGCGVPYIYYIELQKICQMLTLAQITQDYRQLREFHPLGHFCLPCERSRLFLELVVLLASVNPLE